MEQEKYLSEEKYQETNKKVKKTSKILLIIGAILLVIGIIMIIVAFVNLKNSERNVMDSFNNSASNMFDSFNNSINNDTEEREQTTIPKNLIVNDNIADDRKEETNSSNILSTAAERNMSISDDDTFASIDGDIISGSTEEPINNGINQDTTDNSFDDRLGGGEEFSSSFDDRLGSSSDDEDDEVIR